MTTFKQALAWFAREGKLEYREGRNNHNKYAPIAHHADHEPWCATFCCAGCHATGLVQPQGADTASAALNEVAYKRAGRLSSTPRAGTFGFVYFPNMKPRPRVAHQVYVWKVSEDGRWAYTIEGNSNDVGAREGYEVCFRKRPTHREAGRVGLRSYGMPYYTAHATPLPGAHPVHHGGAHVAHVVKPATKPAPKPASHPVQEDDVLTPEDKLWIKQAIADAVAGWVDVAVPLGDFAGDALPQKNGTPRPSATFGQLLQWGAGHAAYADVQTKPAEPADPAGEQPA